MLQRLPSLFLRKTLLLWTHLYVQSCCAQNDSLRLLHIDGSASCSYSGESNWNNHSGSSVLVAGSTDMRYREPRRATLQEFRFRSDLAFLLMKDTVWTKQTDRFSIAYSRTVVWDRKRLCTNGSLESQWLPDAQLRNGERRRSGGFLNPSVWTAAAGLTVEFFSHSRVDFGIAAVRVSVRPEATSFIDDRRPVYHSGKAVIESEYGGSVQVFINESSVDRQVGIDNETRLFFNRIHPDGIHLSSTNRINIHFLKVLLLRLSSALVYQPEVSYHLQFRQEVMLGVFFEHHRLRANRSQGL